uniref:Uncharacterized protein n=1 Tax=Octopus bimaculoides TaxID=37653 RepID=A0A0L8FKZ4_OCTBM
MYCTLGYTLLSIHRVHKWSKPNEVDCLVSQSDGQLLPEYSSQGRILSEVMPEHI